MDRIASIVGEYNIAARQLAAGQPEDLVKELSILEQETLDKTNLTGAELKHARNAMESLRWQIVGIWQDKRAA